MSEDVECPECGNVYGSPRAFYSHWGQSHEGESPEIDAELEFSEEHRRKISENRSGIPHTEETKQKISETLEGRNCWRGHIEPEELGRRISEALEGHEQSDERIENHAKAVKEAWENGAYDDREVDFLSGEDHPNYVHGETAGGYREYPDEFNYQLRGEIRERDGHICQICGDGPEPLTALDVHHRDGDKENNARENLISLCRSCHMKVEWMSTTTQEMAISTGPNPDYDLTDRVVM